MVEIEKINSETIKKSQRKANVIRGVAKAFTIAALVVLIVYCISIFVPIVWMLVTSLKDGDFEYTGNPFGLPKKPVFENYAEMMKMLHQDKSLESGVKVRYELPMLLGYTLFYAVAAAFIGTMAYVICAYVLSRYKFVGCEFLYALGIFVMVTPIIGSSVSAMQLKKAFGCYNNMFMWLITSPSNAFSGMNFLILYGAFKGMANEYAEAAEIDGAGHFSIFFRIYLPMIVPTAAVIFLLGIFNAWNDWYTFLVWLPKYPNLSLAMYTIQNATSIYGVTMPELMAGFTIVCIPTTILYLLTNKVIMSKLTVGGIKG